MTAAMVGTAAARIAAPRKTESSLQRGVQSQQWLIAQLGKLAMLRQAEVGQKTLETFASILSQYRPKDVCSALDRLAHTRREEGETAFPDLATLEEAIRADAAKRLSADKREAERSAAAAEDRDRAEHPENYFSVADAMAEVMRRKGVELRQKQEVKAAAESTAECPKCGAVLILSGATLTHLTPTMLRQLADLLERRSATQ